MQGVVSFLQVCSMGLATGLGIMRERNLYSITAGDTCGLGEQGLRICLNGSNGARISALPSQTRSW